ncbi:MFS transporter [bacterium]|nr:MFS transporter [bacterium]
MRPRPLPGSLAYLAATRLVINTAHRFVYPFLPAISRGLGISLEQAGLLVTARSLASTGTPLLVATVGKGERRSRVIATALVMFAGGSMLAARAPGFGVALIGFALMGAGKPLYDVIAQAYVADRTPYARRARTLAVLELTWAGGLLLGAPAAGWLIGRFGWRAPFAVVAVLIIAALASLPFTIDRDTGATAGTAGPLHLDRSARSLLVVAFIYSISAESVIVVFGAWLEDVFSLSLVALGGAATALALAELTGEGATLLFADRIGKKRTLTAGLAISVAGYLMLAVASQSLGWGLGVIALAFLGFEMTIVATYPLATEMVPRARARYMSLLVVGLYAGRAVGAAIGPVVFSAGGIPANAVTSALLAVAAIVLLAVFVEERSGTTTAS